MENRPTGGCSSETQYCHIDVIKMETKQVKVQYVSWLKSPNLTSFKFLLTGYVKSTVYGSTEHVDDVAELKHWITATTATVSLEILSHV
jgi:pyridoxal/pyridoxine/pyridoxamine kinase